MYTTGIYVYYLNKNSRFNYPKKQSKFNYINKSLIDIHDKFDYNVSNTNSILYFLKYRNSTISKYKTDK